MLTLRNFDPTLVACISPFFCADSYVLFEGQVQERVADCVEGVLACLVSLFLSAVISRTINRCRTQQALSEICTFSFHTRSPMTQDGNAASAAFGKEVGALKSMNSQFTDLANKSKAEVCSKCTIGHHCFFVVFSFVWPLSFPACVESAYLSCSLTQFVCRLALPWHRLRPRRQLTCAAPTTCSAPPSALTAATRRPRRRPRSRSRSLPPRLSSARRCRVS